MQHSADDWKPTCGLERLHLRGELLKSVRAFFERRGYREVETPILSRDVVVDAWLDPFSVALPGGTRYLQTSPEACMKRLLAAGSGSIFQIARVFRRDESGTRHNPEFTMVEWYGVDTTMDDQIRVTEELVRDVVDAARRWRVSPGRTAAADATATGSGCEFSGSAFARCTYEDAFRRVFGQSVLESTVAELIALARDRQLELPGPTESLTLDTARNFLLASVVEPQLGVDHPEFLTHFPASQAALARICPNDPRVALRFELFAGGLELCNGYEELTDRNELELRDAGENAVRSAHGNDVLPGAPRLLAAMQHGLPSCSGVALGFDRLAMLATGADSIREVIPFPFDVA